MKKKAKIFITLDNSGSMGSLKRNAAKYIYNSYSISLNLKYNLLNPLLIQHSTTACVCFNEENFFDDNTSGGTYLSSGINLIMESDLCDGFNTLLIFSDGDNWNEDNKIFIEKIKFLLNYFDEITFFEIKTSRYASTIVDTLNSEIKNKKFKIKKIDPKKIKIKDKLQMMVEITEKIKGQK